MDFNDSLKYSVCSFDLDNKNISNYDANNKIIIISTQYYLIDIYSMDTKNLICSKEFYTDIVHFQLHPKYYNILSVSLKDSKVLLFNIDIDNNKIEEKVVYKSLYNKRIDKTIFSPFKYGNILATLSYNNISIWDMNSYFYIYNIYFKEQTRSKNIDIKWDNSGEYLIFQRYEDIIEVFSLTSMKYEFSIESSSYNYFYDKNKKQMILFEDGKIIIYDIEKNVELNKIDCIMFSCKKSIYDEDNSLLYLLDKENIFVYDLQLKKSIFEYKVKSCKNFFLLENYNYNEPNLLSKLILYTKEKKFEILSIFNNGNNGNKNNFFSIKGIAPNNFWEYSIKIIDDNYDFLSYKNNKYEKDELNPKNYLSIKEISDEVDDSLQKYTLKEKRKLVKTYKTNLNENKGINITYINYLKNIIKDNTNTDLLENYLLFLKTNEKKLESIYGKNFEKYNDEINQFQVCFEQSFLNQKLTFLKTKSEKEELIELFNDILKINNLDDLNIYISKKQNLIHKFRFNQPISFKNKELYLCQNKLIVLYSLKDIINEKDSDSFENIQYVIKKILEGNLLNNTKIINNNLKLSLLFILISSPQDKLLTDYNLNLIDDKDIFITEDIIIQLGFKYNNINESFEYFDKNIIIPKDKIKLYNLENLKLIIKNENEENEEDDEEEKEFNNFKNYELYKYDALMEYYKNEFDEDNVRKFINKILSSNVMKEAFKFFYGDEIKYPFLDDEKEKGEDKAEKFLKKYLKFIPFKFKYTSALTNKFSMETYIFLNSKIISIKIKKSNNSSIDNKMISKALINGAIVLINDHECNHNFHNYFYLSKNGKESIKTPRKKDLESREGGYNMENILFGELLNKLTLRQVLYILNEDNYKKSLNQFRIDFFKLKDEDCQCKGIFKDYSTISKELTKLLDYTAVRFKLSYSNDEPYISIFLKNDVLGFRSQHKNK